MNCIMFLHANPGTPILFSTFNTLVEHLVKVGKKNVDYVFHLIDPDTPVEHQVVLRLTAGFAGETYISGHLLKYDPHIEMRMNPMTAFMTGTDWNSWLKKNGKDVTLGYDYRITREGVGYLNVKDVLSQEKHDWSNVKLNLQ